jgi:hypothetical protein
MILNIVLAAIALYFIVDAVIAYHRAVGSVWQRTLAAGKQSATIVWARLVVIITAGISGLAWLADFVNQPGVSAAITTYLKPNVVAGIMVAVAVITELARRRTL